MAVGLARQSLEEIVETLQALHPQEDPLDLDQKLPVDEECINVCFYYRKMVHPPD